ncbi:MAG: C4-dicarboxylate ABC transporter permease [Deltaproteobacteria bacterium CG11_big_fil_rev_8_21_14_0_20_49_13]|nr:MAG: C4-dicarboxylate ABC transporter permease [Deltaproteobacteria bacterium CG11_big_fil_rev_8_21_14_0_20_49_13]
MSERILSKIVTALLIIFLSFMIGIAFLQIILRNFFDTGFSWADVTVRHMVLWVGFLGAVIAAIEDRHISLDIFSRMLPQKFKKYVSKLVYLGSSFVCAVLAYASYKFVASERMMESELFAGVPVWLAEVVIPVTFAMLGFLFLIRVILRPKAEGSSEIN